MAKRKLGATNSHSIRCPKCNVTTKVPLEATAYRCPNCGTQVTIPDAVRQAGKKQAATVRNIGIVAVLLLLGVCVYGVAHGGGFDSTVQGAPSCAGGHCELVIDVFPHDATFTGTATCTVSGHYPAGDQVIGSFQAGPFTGGGNGKEVRWLTPSLDLGEPTSWSVSCK